MINYDDVNWNDTPADWADGSDPAPLEPYDGYYDEGEE